MAQDGGTGDITFHGEMDRYRKSEGWTTAYSTLWPSVTGRNKVRVYSPKQPCSCWFVRRSGLASRRWFNLSSICMRPDSHTQLVDKYLLVSSFFFFFFSLEMSLLPSTVHHCRLPCEHGLDF